MSNCQTEMKIDLPNLKALPDAKEADKETIQHFNALMDELRWFYANGVHVAFKPKKNGYSMNFKAGK